MLIMLPPHELKNKEFTKSMRGYNPVEVDEYIEFLIQKYTELYRENDELERKLRAAVTHLDELKGDEDSIRSTLIDAKRAANKIKADAEERAEAIVRSAKSSCNAILSDFNRKIELGRETMALLQNDVFDLKRELFERYSDHIQYIEKLTEGIDEAAIPETSEFRKKAVDELKSSIANSYQSTPVSEPEIAEDVEDAFEAIGETETIVDEDSMKEYGTMDIVTTAADDELLEVAREPLSSDKQTLKGSVAELNRQYKESSDEVINTPDSDLGDDESYLDFVKSVTGNSAKNSKKEEDFNLLFSDNPKKKK